jgi:hypothetical protein
MVQIYTEPEQLELESMAKYLDVNGENLVINARWSHCEETWLEDDSDCVTDEFSITFTFELGDVCAKNIISLGEMTKEHWYDVKTDGSSAVLLEIPRGTIQAAYSRCSLSTTVQVKDVGDNDTWTDLENTEYFTSTAVEYSTTFHVLMIRMDLSQYTTVQTALELESAGLPTLFRFVTVNDDVSDQQVVYDKFIVKINGPAMCEQNILDLDTTADLNRAYAVAFTVDSAAPADLVGNAVSQTDTRCAPLQRLEVLVV